MDDIPLYLRNMPNANQFTQFRIITITVKVSDPTKRICRVELHFTLLENIVLMAL